MPAAPAFDTLPARLQGAYEVLLTTALLRMAFVLVIKPQGSLPILSCMEYASVLDGCR
jgi:hypothetical protein